jgi:hypothetical protein
LSSGKQYQPIDLRKQTKIHVLRDLDLKALITLTFPVPESIMRTVGSEGMDQLTVRQRVSRRTALPANSCRTARLKDGAVGSFGRGLVDHRPISRRAAAMESGAGYWIEGDS